MQLTKTKNPIITGVYIAFLMLNIACRDGVGEQGSATLNEDSPSAGFKPIDITCEDSSNNLKYYSSADSQLTMRVPGYDSGIVLDIESAKFNFVSNELVLIAWAPNLPSSSFKVELILSVLTKDGFFEFQNDGANNLPSSRSVDFKCQEEFKLLWSLPQF